MARPTLYNEQILIDTKQYIDDCHDTPADKESDIPRQVNLPTIEGLAYHLKINKDTIYDWRKIYLEFSELIDELLHKQALSLVNNGLSGNYNSTIAKVLLTKHGYREGIETDITSGGKVINSADPKLIALAEKYEQELKKTL
jgi:hypothetical protein